MIFAASLTWNKIAKYAAALAMALVVVGGMAYGAHLIHKNGREVEKSVWVQKTADANKARAEDKARAEARRKAELEQQEKELLGALSDEKKKLAELEKRERDQLAANRGLWATIEGLSNFGSGACSGEGEGSSVGSPTSNRVRLSRSDAENIRRDYGDADRVAIQYETCRKTLIPLVEIIPD